MADMVRRLANTLSEARDEQVARAVALVDAMQARGEADALIAPLRARLSRLRPARKLRLARVLFTPLDPVIVPAAAWQERTATLPRTALGPIEQIVRAGLGAETAVIEAAVADASSADPFAVARIGAMLWKPAADVLRRQADRVPAAWTDAGLPAALFHPIRLAVTAVLAAASEIEACCGRDQGSPPGADELERLLRAALPDGPGACATLGAVLLSRLPHASPDILLALAALGETDANAAPIPTQHAIEAALGQVDNVIVGEVGSAPLPTAARAIERAARLLEGLGRNAGPLRRERLDAIRTALATQSRERFAETLDGWLAEPALPLPDAGASLAPAMEASARDLRRFETAARQLGGGASYDQALRRAADQVRAMPDSVALTRVERLRLAEILAGSEQALRLFGLG